MVQIKTVIERRDEHKDTVIQRQVIDVYLTQGRQYYLTSELTRRIHKDTIIKTVALVLNTVLLPPFTDTTFYDSH